MSRDHVIVIDLRKQKKLELPSIQEEENLHARKTQY